MYSYVILVDRNGKPHQAPATPQGWRCPLDDGDLGDLTGYRQPRIGTRCPRCGAVVCETLP